MEFYKYYSILSLPSWSTQGIGLDDGDRQHYYSKKDRGHWLTIDDRRENNLSKSKERKEDKS